MAAWLCVRDLIVPSKRHGARLFDTGGSSGLHGVVFNGGGGTVHVPAPPGGRSLYTSTSPEKPAAGDQRAGSRGLGDVRVETEMFPK